MSLPPHVLKIKRKRIDDPVDSLLLEQRDPQQHVKRRHTEHSYVFRRLAGNQENQYRPPKLPSAIPEIRMTLPGEENGYYGGKSQRSAGVKDQEVDGCSNDTAASAEPTNDEERVPAIPMRVFRLARSVAVAHTAQSDSFSARHPIFVEKTTSTASRGPQSNNGDSSTAVELTQDEESEAPLKRPSGHVHNYEQQRVEKKQSQEKLDIKMEEAMYQLAADLEVEQQPHPLDQAGRNESDDDADMMDVADEAVYVYDTFVRDEAPRVIGSTSMDTMSSSLDKGGIGYLIIEEEDQDLWETYAEKDDDSDPEWDSEQDDENAENFYGADYPEDEVDYDDEYNRQANKYRHKGAADDEEFDSDSDVWSDGEELKETLRAQQPWRGLDEIDASDSDEDGEVKERVASML